MFSRGLWLIERWSKAMTRPSYSASSSCIRASGSSLNAPFARLNVPWIMSSVRPCERTCHFAASPSKYGASTVWLDPR